MKLICSLASLCCALHAPSGFAGDDRFLAKFNSELELTMPSNAASSALRARVVDWVRRLREAAPEIKDASLWSSTAEKIVMDLAIKRADQMFEALAAAQTLYDEQGSRDEQTAWVGRALAELAHLYAELGKFRGNPKRHLFSGIRDASIVAMLPGAFLAVGIPATEKQLGLLPNPAALHAAATLGAEVGAATIAASVALVVALAPRIPATRDFILNQRWALNYDRVTERAERAFWGRLRSRIRQAKGFQKLLPANLSAPIAPMVMTRLNYLGGGVPAACELLLKERPDAATVEPNARDDGAAVTAGARAG